LNQILARDTRKLILKVIDVIVVDPTLLLPELTVLAENKIHNSVFDQERVAELQLKQVKALRYPTIRVNTGYTFSDSQSWLYHNLPLED
jgi:hypothetical protein